MAADIVVFDSTTVIDHATYERPMESAEGIRFVLVNGRLVMRGTATTPGGGRILRRGMSMPSRPTNFAAARSITVEAPNATVRVTQSPTDRSARGQLRITSPGFTIVCASLGLLQTARGWGSVSGRGVVNGVERSFVLMLDGRDPLEPASSWATILVPGVWSVRVALPIGSVRVVGGG